MPEFRETIEAERRTGIGGSDIAALLGVSRRRTRYDLYLEKTGTAKTPEVSPSGKGSSFYWGTIHERLIADAYIRLTKRRVRRRNSVIRHFDRQHFIGHLDFLVHLPDGSRPYLPNGEIRADLCLECATSFFPTESWGASGSNRIPIPYALKVQWYMGLMPSVKAFDLAVLFGGRDLRIYRVHRDEMLIAYLQKEAERFWMEHVLKRIPPPPLNEKEVRRMYPESSKKMAPAVPSVLELLRDYLRAEQARIHTESIRSELRGRILAYMGAAGELSDTEGRVLATFRKASNGRRLFKITKTGNALLNRVLKERSQEE